MQLLHFKSVQNTVARLKVKSLLSSLCEDTITVKAFDYVSVVTIKIVIVFGP